MKTVVWGILALCVQVVSRGAVLPFYALPEGAPTPEPWTSLKSYQLRNPDVGAPLRCLCRVAARRL